MRCPVCRAADNQTDQCRRCKADLSLLVRLERERSTQLAQAQRHAGRGDSAACLRAALRAHDLLADKNSFRLLALGKLLAKDFTGAWTAYRGTASQNGTRTSS
jgi:hypothetical protein